MYVGTDDLMVYEFLRFGSSLCFAATVVESFAEACGNYSRMFFLESPSNPLLTVVELTAVATFAKPRKIFTVIDNTFASPILQNPLEDGFDLVMHSGTKYLGGHSDLCCGTVNGSVALIEKVRDHAVAYGGCLNAQDCYLLERSLKTLELRVNRQSSNAAIIAERLNENEHIKRVYYPGLKSHPGFEVATRQMQGYGGMLSFELADDIDPVSYIRRLQIVNCAISLGGVETTICQPVATSHQKVSEEERQRLGITSALLRLSVGIEDAQDISADLIQALTRGV
jgi:cystathionine beta-lyase/cystathionine gamma-synthase